MRRGLAPPLTGCEVSCIVVSPKGYLDDTTRGPFCYTLYTCNCGFLLSFGEFLAFEGRA